MAIVTIQEAQASLPDLIHNLVPGDELVITENDRPVAKLVSEPTTQKTGLRPPPGLGKGYITIDDEHLKDFAENDRPTAGPVGSPTEKPRPIPGRCKGMLTILAEDDEHLEDFKEYMP